MRPGIYPAYFQAVCHRIFRHMAVRINRKTPQKVWCRGPDSNRHGGCPPQDFKSCTIKPTTSRNHNQLHENTNETPIIWVWFVLGELAYFGDARHMGGIWRLRGRRRLSEARLSPQDCDDFTFMIAMSKHPRNISPIPFRGLLIKLTLSDHDGRGLERAEGTGAT